MSQLDHWRRGLAAALMLGLISATASAAPGPAQPAPASSAPAAAAPAKPAVPAKPAATATPSQQQPQAQPAALNLPAISQALAKIQNQLEAASSDDQLAQLGQQVEKIDATIDSAAQGQIAQFDAITAQLRQDAAAHRRPTSAQRKAVAALKTQQATLEAQLAPVRAVASQADALYSQIAERRRQSLTTRLLQPSPSPLTPDFWTGLASAAGSDFGRLAALARWSASVALQAPEPQAGAGLAFCLALGMLAVFPARRWLERLGRRKVNKEAAYPGIARTTSALWVVAVDTGLPTLAALLLQLGAQWGGLLSREANAVATAAVAAVAWVAAILAIGRVLVADSDGSRRLAPVSDDDAARIRPSLWAVALITGAGFLLVRFNYVIGASVAATIASDCVMSLAYAAAAGLILVGFKGGGEGEAPADRARSPTWTLVSLALGIAIVVTVGAVFAGYATLATLVSGQIFWLSLIAAVAYLLLRFVDDLFEALFGPHGPASRALAGIFNLSGASVRQAGLLLAAALQLLVLIAAVSLALIPFGSSGDLLINRLGELGQTMRIGSAVISPSAIATGIATFAIGMALVHMARQWLVRRYLPVTGWDSGLRNSVSTGLGYLGVLIVIVCALAATGIGFNQIALVASALSVGIGFGLQQIVQNFVAGVILLIERPIKVGDWVNIGGTEGDVRRIRVRATEIQAGDRSIMMVPNSDLITKTIQNKTLTSAHGQVTLQVSVARAADARRAADLILAAAKANPAVLADPAPSVSVDSLNPGGGVNLVGSCAVAGPRDVYGVRSQLYFAILEAFEAGGVYLQGALAAPAPPFPQPPSDQGLSDKPLQH